MKQRIHILDEWRGACVVLMVIYHALYTLGATFFLEPFSTMLSWFEPVEPLFAGMFVFLCGVSCRLSRNNLKRGLLLAGVAVLMSVVLWFVMPTMMIWFGILHCLAVCILLYAAIHRLLDRIPVAVGICVCGVLLLVTWWFPWYQGGLLGVPPLAIAWPESWRSYKLLMPFGVGTVYSADYFPLIPWVFCFFGGAFCGRLSNLLPAWCYRLHSRFLAFTGRHALVIYLLHQPILYGIVYAVYAVVS